MPPKNTLLRLSAFVVAVLSIGLPLRAFMALNQTGFRGHVHWGVWVVEFLSIVMCRVLAGLLRFSDKSLSPGITICACVGILFCILIALTPAW